MHHEFSHDTDCHLYNRQDDEAEYKYKANVHAEQLHNEYRELHHYLLNVLSFVNVDYFVQYKS